MGHRQFSIIIFILAISSFVLLDLSIHVPTAAAAPVSWNPNVPCTPTIVKLRDILGPAYPDSHTLAGSQYQVSSGTGGVPNKRALSAPSLPCTITNINGQTVQAFVQLNNVTLNNYLYETRDCSTKYDAVNGGGSFPNGETLCDSTGNVNEVGTTNGAYIHIEIDRDWMAAVHAGPSTTYDNNNTIAQVHLPCTIASPCSSSVAIDVQGFVFWDTEGHWELHPFTAWQLHSSFTTSLTYTPSNPSPGTSISFTATATGGKSPYTFSWNFGDGNTATGNPVSHSYSVKGSYTVILTAHDSAGANATATASIPVSPQTLATSVSCGTATAGKPVTCTATATGGTSPYTFSWSAPGGSPSTGTGSSFTTTYAVKGTYIVNATATDGNGAKKSQTGSISVTPQTLQVTIAAACSTALSTATAGKPVSCSATASGGTAPVTFKWTAVGGTPSTGTGSTFTVTYNVKGTYTLTVNATDANNKSATQSVSGFAVTPQAIVVTASCGTVTIGKPVTCNASASGGTSPFTFSWSAPGGIPTTGTGSSFTTTYATKGAFVVNATATDANTVKKSGTISIVIAGQPLIVTISCGTATASKPVACTASASGGTPPYTFTWASKGTPATGTGTSYTTTFATKGSQVMNATAKDNNSVSKLGQSTVAVVAQPIFVTVSCGSATAGKPLTCIASATGGTSPYTFSWSALGGSPATGSGSSFTTTYAAKGTFVVNATATDLNNVKKSQTASIVVAPQPVVVRVSCGAATAGKPVTCTASAIGGTSPYAFSWSAPGGNPAIGTGSSITTTYSTKGTFVVNATATDFNNVKTFQTLNIIVTAQPFTLTVNCGSATAGKPVTCTASATGGTTPYTFFWSAPSGTPATGTGASFTTSYATKGTFSLNATATDNNNAKQSQTVNVVAAAQPLAIVILQTPATATVGKPVNFTAAVSGGTSPFKFQWFINGNKVAGATSSSLTTTFNTAGNYSVTVKVTDANHVTNSQTLTLTVQNQTPKITVTCLGGTAGKPVSCSAVATDGTPPYTFSWSSNGIPATGTGSSYTTTLANKGTLSVTGKVTDSAGATNSTTTIVTVNAQPIVVTVTCGSVTAGKPVTCNASATGGTAPYTFTWSSNGSPAAGTGSSYTTTFTAKGTQTVTATVKDANNVSQNGTVTVSVAAQPIVVTVSCGSATSGKPVTCSASATGGTSPYTFSWAAPGGSPTIGAGSSFTTNYATKGTFIVNATATDSNSVKKSQTASLVVAAQPIVVTTACGSATAGQPVTCSASATGGTAPYTFSWSASGSSPSSGTSSSFNTTYATKGSYSINTTATDANNAKNSATASILVSAQSISFSIADPPGFTTGVPISFTSSVGGGTGPYTFSWSAPNGSPATGSGQNFTTTFATKGTFTVNATVTDANGGRKSATATVVVASQPLSVIVTCDGATAGKPTACSASALGGTSPFTFSWSAPGGSPSVGSGSIFTTTYATKGTVVINATVTDNNNARNSQTAIIIVAVQPLAISVTCGSATASKPVACTASATSGTSPYTFSWSAPGGSPATGTEATFTTTYATKGTFTVNVTATDNNGAKTSQLITINVDAQTLQVTISAACVNALATATAGKPVNCSATATGGTTPYTVQWTAVGGTPSSGTGSSFTVSYAVKGTYTLTVNATDANNKSSVQSVANFVVTPQALAITALCGTATAGKPVTCNASATGGTTPFTFSWSAPGGTPSTGTGASFTTTYSIKGTFTVNATATDNNGAKEFGLATVGVASQAFAVTVTCGSATAGKPVTCDASASGGSTPITFSWSAPGSSPPTGTGASFTTSYATKGSFTVNATAIDSNGAKKSATAAIVVTTQPIAVTVSCGTATAGKPVTCNASATGGTTPFTFSWSAPGGTPSTGSGSSFTTTYATKGTFIVNATATDTNNVQKSQITSLVVTAQPMVLTVTCGSATSGKPVTCNASATGGTSPYAFSWTSTSSSPSSGTGSSFTTTFPAKGTYTVKTVVVDANGSNSSKNTSVTVTAQPLVADFTYNQPLVAGTTGTFTGTATGGTSPYAFKWSFGDGSPLQTGNPASHSYTIQGSYTVTLNVTDTNSVSLTVQKTVLVTAGLLVSFSYDPVAPTVQQTVSFNATISGGTGPYSASWVFGDNNNGLGATVSHVYNNFGNYTVTLTVTDANSTTATSGRLLTVTPEIDVSRAPAASFQTIFNGTATEGTGAISYQWSFGDGTTGTGQGVSHVFSTNGTYTVTLTVTDPSGKTGSKSTQIIVILNPDIDGSGKVEIVDIAHIALAFGSKNGDAKYDPTFDLNWDGKIDILDVALAAFYFGRTVGS